MAIILARSNDALEINPPVGDFHLATHGSDWLWAVTAIYTLSLLVVIGLSYRAKNGEKIFHYLFTITLFTGTLAYFTMASDLGSVAVKTSTQDSGSRQIFYARYINWFVGWTPILLAVGVISGVSWATIIYNIALSWIWVVSWLSGALVATTYKWGFFTFGIFAYFLLAASLLLTGRTCALRLDITKNYLLISGYLVFFWLLYPIAWGVDDGGNVIKVTAGHIFVGILDLFTGPFFAILVLVLVPKLDFRSLNLYFTQYGRVAPVEYPEGPVREKIDPTAAPATLDEPAQVHDNPEQV